jgi:hypothetical protein
MRRRFISAVPFDHDECMSCAKKSVRRKGKSPAPIRLLAGPNYMSLCMTCAKKISSCLDAVIERIESKYVDN